MKRLLQLAPRSLGVCRVLAGLTVMADLIWRAPALRLHYTDSGIWPVPFLLDHSPGPVFPSLYFLATTPFAVVGLFAIQGVAGASLALGYRTQLSTAVCWFLVRSLHARQPTVLNGGDHLFAMLLFWGMFVPWGAALSVDSRTCGAGSDTPQQRLASALFALQLPWLYWVAFYHKLEPSWLRGDAVAQALGSEFFARPAAAALLAHPLLTQFLDYLVLGWEAVGPLLLLSPWRKARVAAALTFAAMHVGMACFLRVGLFAWTPCLFLIALMPEEVFTGPSFDTLQRRLRELPLSAGPAHQLPAEARPFLLFLAALCVAQSAAWKDPPLVPDSLRWVETATGLRQDWTMFTGLDRLDDGWLSLEATLPSGQTVELLGAGALSRLHPQDRWAGALWKVALDSYRQERFAVAMVKALAPEAIRARLLFVRKPPWSGFRDQALQPSLLWEGRTRAE